MDPFTHALAAYSLKRAAFPGISHAATLSVVFAGTIADIDLFSSYFGPSAYLAIHHTYFHSLVAAIAFSLLVTLPFFLFTPQSPEHQVSRVTIFTAAFAAALLHLVLDLCRSARVELLWPFSTRRFAMDWLPS